MGMLEGVSEGTNVGMKVGTLTGIAVILTVGKELGSPVQVAHTAKDLLVP